MKRISVSTMLLVAVLTMWAAPVTQQQAKDYAAAYFTAMCQRETSVRSIETIGTGPEAYHIVNFYPQGWAIIAGDDTATPVIGYSRMGKLCYSDMPDNMRGAMNYFSQELRQVARTGSGQHPKWQQRELMVQANGESVDPLIQVHWDQPAPYNKYCPMGEALVGCVAVSMSQAMSVQRYPDRPVGSVSYRHATYGTLSLNYNEQKAYNWEQIMSGANNYDEVARLLMHAGYAVQMDYGVDGSGVPLGQLGRVVTALTTNFKYPNSVRQVKRDTYSGNWTQLLKNELNAGRAIVYNGLDSKHSAGHAFNVDGYDAQGKFHVNWGWSGTGDGFFSIDGLGHGSDFYDAMHIIIIGIDAGDRPLRSIELSHTEVEEGQEAGSTVGQLTVNGTTVANGMTVNVHGTWSKSKGAFLDVPFTYENGMLRTTQQLRKGDSYTVEISVSDDTNELTQGFVIDVTEVRDLETATTLSYDRSTQTFTLKTKNNVSYTMTGASGQTLGEGALSPLPQLTLERSQLTDGDNTLMLRSATETLTLTIKK